ncbi:MAG TPA: AAA family ATPase [Roseiflexaceae bacterium]|nr:AAA family ATPase [Roseiflexaceae bacterium]
MTTRDNVHPISDADLDARRGDAEFRMQNIPMRGVAYDLLAELRKLPGIGGYLLGERVNQVLHTLRRGLCLYYELYDELGGKLGQRNPAFLGSYALFGLGALVAHTLPQVEGEDLAGFQAPDGRFFRVGVGADDDLKSLLSFYLKAITQTQPDGTPVIESADDLLALSRDYFAAARDQMVADSDALPADLLAQVEGITFRIGDLELRGFSVQSGAAAPKATFTPVLPEQIVGNTSAKRALVRYVDRLALYDVARGFNPVLELGGLPATVLFDGFPGTGKTSLFRMAMTRLQERGEQTGLPVRFVTIDPSIKDEYYGKTAKLLTEKLALTRDPAAITLVFFDDVDLLLLSRGDPGMGGSDKDVLNLTMQFLDGAFTKHIGNAQTYAATNEPTATDSALRQRFHHRELIAGPEDWDDYAALLGIKLARQIQLGLVPVGGELPTPRHAAATGAAPAASAPAEERRGLGALFGGGKKSMSWRELGELCAEFKRKDPRFTGRPIESVTQKLLAESADFELPEEWFTDPALFLSKTYDEKLELLKQLYRPITGEMIAAELEHYFNSEQRYADDARAQRAQRIAADLEAQLAARDLLDQKSPE